MSISQPPDYDKLEYWEDRYEGTQKSFDWYLIEFKRIASLVDFYFPEKNNVHVLECGCGNSKFSVDAYDHGFQSVTGVDYSNNCINLQTRLHSDGRPGLKFQMTDLRNMDKFESSSFHLIIDKATLDAIDCGEDDTNSSKAAAEYMRVVNKNGVVIVVTCRNPLRRLNSFKTLGFEVVEISELLKPPNDKQPDIQYIVVLRPTETVPKELNIDSVKRTAIDYHGNYQRVTVSESHASINVSSMQKIIKPDNGIDKEGGDYDLNLFGQESSSDEEI